MHRIDEYLNSPAVTNLAPTTQNNYRYALESLRRYCIRNLMSTLDKAFPTQAYMDDLMQGVSGQTAQQYITVIKMFFKHIGHPLDFSFKIPSAQIKAKKVKSLERWFSDREVGKCLDWRFPTIADHLLRVRNEALVGLLIDTGARIAEIAAIRAENIILSNRTVHLGISKTQPRAGFFSEHTEDLLRDYKSGPKEWAGPIFPSADASKRIVIKMLKDLKIHKPGRGPHTFRHWVANHLYFDKGMDLIDVAFLLGDSPDVIRKTYLHPTPEQMRSRLKDALAA
jgi:site-specific recombinase XerD